MLRSSFSLRNLLTIALCSCGFLALAGCGGASSQTASGSSPGSSSPHATTTPAHTSGGPQSNICPLITPAQLLQITGITFNSGIVVNPGGSPAPGEIKDAHCGYQQTVNKISNVGDSAFWFNSTAAANSLYTGFRTNYASEGANPVDVSGLGDKAFSFRGGLFALKGAVLFFITYVPPAAQQADANLETQIAQIVLPQL